MSAFICGDKHIASLASWYGIEKGLAPVVTQFIADELKKANIKSVNYRYNDKIRMAKCKMNKAILILPEEALAMSRCLDYQSCEKQDFVNQILIEIEALALYLSDSNWKSDIWELV